MRAYVRAACSQYERFEFKDDIVKKNWIRKYWDENNALWMKWFHGGRDWNKVWIHLWVCVCVASQCDFDNEYRIRVTQRRGQEHQNWKCDSKPQIMVKNGIKSKIHHSHFESWNWLFFLNLSNFNRSKSSRQRFGCWRFVVIVSTWCFIKNRFDMGPHFSRHENQSVAGIMRAS